VSRHESPGRGTFLVWLQECNIAAQLFICGIHIVEDLGLGGVCRVAAAIDIQESPLLLSLVVVKIRNGMLTLRPRVSLSLGLLKDDYK